MLGPHGLPRNTDIVERKPSNIDLKARELCVATLLTILKPLPAKRCLGIDEE
jgi:hypothetical protein